MAPLPGDHREVVPAAIDDLNTWWAENFPKLYGAEYSPVQKVVAGNPGTTLPRCFRQGTGRYRDVAGNAFYCPDGQDFIAYDDASLFAELTTEYGSAAAAVVIAHEWGHAIQWRARVDEQSVIMEQQADCYAGAWTGHAMNDSDALVKIPTAELPRVLGAMISVADTKGVSANNPQAHGSGFDRASAFQDGFVNGPKACVDYPTNPPTVLQFPFTTQSDLINGGNLPLNQTLDLMVRDLDMYWAQEFTASGAAWTQLGPVVPVGDSRACATESVAYCGSTSSVAFDPAFIEKAYRTGDFAVGVQFGLVWAQAALQVEGSGANGKQRRLRQDCYVGAWASDQLPDRQTTDSKRLTLSPGDLDEAVISFVAQSSDGGDPVFDRLSSFRSGLLGGRSACKV